MLWTSLSSSVKNLPSSDSVILDVWLDGIIKEQESQRDSMTGAIESLWERSQQLLVQRKGEVAAMASSGGEHFISKPPFTFKSVENIRPSTLMKDIRHSELQA